jgi:hypothetical protein
MLLVQTSSVGAEPAQTSVSAERERAAAAYDRAVEAYERGAFREAAVEFLAADAVVPSTDAIVNAIAAARRARDPLLMASAADRGIAREKSAPWLARQARAALAEAEQELGRLVLACSPLPCELELDGQPVSAGARRVLPGLHLVRARAPGGDFSERKVDVPAASEQRLTIEVLPQRAASKPVRAQPAPGEQTPETKPTGTQQASTPSFARPLFYAGVGATVLLAAITTWSGIDALNARSELPGTVEETEDVRARGYRTDALLVGTLLVGAATTYVGIRWIANERKPEQVVVTARVAPGGASLTLAGAL